MQSEGRVYTNFSEAVQGLRRFLRKDCPDRAFQYESSDPFPANNCLCWVDYRNPVAIVASSLRYAILTAALNQPFSTPKTLAFRMYGASIQKTAYISPQVHFDPLFPSLLTIEEGVLLGVGSRIALHEHGGKRFKAGRVIIRRGATIGADAKIACGVEIGEFAIVGLGAVVLRDVPPRAIVIGNPARVVKRLAA